MKDNNMRQTPDDLIQECWCNQHQNFKKDECTVYGLANESKQKNDKCFYKRMKFIDWVFKMDLRETNVDIAIVVIYVLTIVVLMLICKKLFEGSRSKVVEISSPLRHIIKDNQTYSLTSIWMMRIVQILLLLTFLHYIFLIVLLVLPENTFQSFYLQTGSLLDFCKIHIEKETRDEKLYNGYSGMYMSPQVNVFEI